MPVVALLTDFGLKDPYVGIMKAVILSHTRGVVFIDLGHELDAHAISSAAYLLVSAWEYLPSGTVSVSVVDPGVGSERRILCVEAGGKYLISPDNGSASLLLEAYPGAQSFYLTADLRRSFLAKKKEYSATFDGRDVFAPAAAALCSRGFPSVIGDPAEPLTIDMIKVRRTEDRTAAGGSRPGLEARIIHIDRFGNCISSLSIERFRREKWPQPANITFFKKKSAVLELNSIGRFFAQAEEGAPICYWGSAGYLELAVNRGNAARRYGLEIGDRLRIL